VKLSARRLDDRVRHVRSALLGMMLLSSVNIPLVNALCDSANSYAAFSDNAQLKSEAASYAGNAANWRSIVTNGMTNAVRFGTNIVSCASGLAHILYSNVSEQSVTHP
jgi:hypothetical protein